MSVKRNARAAGKRNKDVLEGWAVVRVSKENEVKDGSPTQQINVIKDWTKRQKERTGKTYKIVHYVVEDGKSGRYQNTHKRKEILHLVELVKMGAIDFVVNEKLDRFSRDEVLNIQIMRDARKNGVELHEVNYGQFDPNDRGQRMAWKFRNIEAGEYSEGVSENVARKHRSAMVFNGKDASPCPVLDSTTTNAMWVFIPSTKRNWRSSKTSPKNLSNSATPGRERSATATKRDTKRKYGGRRRGSKMGKKSLLKKWAERPSTGPP